MWVGGVISVTAVVLAALAGCTPQRQDVVTSCMFDVSPQGSYTYEAGVAVPVVTPAEGGTPEGAALLNACISGRLAGQGPQGMVASDRYVAAGTTTPQASSADILRHRKPYNAYDQSACPGGMSGMYGGVSYCTGD